MKASDREETGPKTLHAKCMEHAGQSIWLFVLSLNTFFFFLKKYSVIHFFLSFTQWVKTIAFQITALV